MLDDEGFVVGAIDGPGAGGRRRAGKRRRQAAAGPPGRLQGARWAGRCKHQGARAEQKPRARVAVPRGAGRWRGLLGERVAGWAAEGAGSHRLGRMHSAVVLLDAGQGGKDSSPARRGVRLASAILSLT